MSPLFHDLEILANRPYSIAMAHALARGLDMKFSRHYCNRDVDFTPYGIFKQGEIMIGNQMIENVKQNIQENFTINDVNSFIKRGIIGGERLSRDIQQELANAKPAHQKIAASFQRVSYYNTVLVATLVYERVLMELLRTELQNALENEDIEQTLLTATYTDKPTAFDRMMEHIQQEKDNEKVHAAFAWLKDREGLQDHFTIEEIAAYREKVDEHFKDKEQGRKQQEAFDTDYRHHIDTPLKELIDTARELVWFRTHRTDIFYESLGLMRPTILEYARNKGINYKEIGYYTLDEIEQDLVNTFDVRERKKGYYVYKRDGKVHFGYGDHANQVYDEIIKRIVGDTQDTLKGVVANSGNVIGKVAIVHSIGDLEKVYEGDILVTRMTWPAYIHAMKRAAAFVTNEGGITCHAAIISRELNKPCIIGTKVATKVLKDGDKVEVNADEGVVRKIKK